MDNRAVIVAGPNGSGKTTFALEFLNHNDLVYLSADAIAEELSPNSIDERKIAAGRLFLTRTNEHITHRKNILIETTLSGLSFKRIAKRLSEKEYSTSLVFIFLESADACVCRVMERTRKGGHFIPPDDVKRRFYRSLNNFWQTYRHLVVKWHWVYNASNRFIDVATGIGDMTTVRDDELFEIFLQHVEK